jgi:hypothetical protein
VTSGRTSAGNSTFRIRFPPAINTFEASSSAAENHVQGRMPQNMKTAYGSNACGRAPGMTTVKTNV